MTNYILMKARFAGRCACTGIRFHRGQTIAWFRNLASATLPAHAERFQRAMIQSVPMDGQMAQAEQEARFDNFCIQNGI